MHKCYFYQKILVVSSAILLIFAFTVNFAWSEETIKVGIFQNKPIVYFEDERPQGLFVEILDHVAQKEGWQLEYVSCDLKECLSLIRSNKIDLMTSLGESPERARYLTFSKEPIWTFWGTILSHDIKINSVFDLKGKKIGVRSKNKITAAVKKLLSDFEIPVEYAEFPVYEKAFKALQDGTVDAVAVNNTYAFKKQTQSHFHKTPIVFNPFSAYFAVPKMGGDQRILDTLDKYARQLKADNSSLYYRFERRWFGVAETYWTGKRIGTVSVVLLFLSICLMAYWRCRSLVAVNRELSNNIAERKTAEEALAKSEAHLRTLINTIPDLIWMKDEKGIYLLCNARFERFFGASEKDIIGKTDHDFIDRELADFFRKHDNAAMEAGKPCLNEEEVTYADDGHRELLETIKTPMFDRDGNLMGILGIARDITERRKEEEEKRKLEARLTQAQKMEAIGTLAGGIAHDFNNILSVVLGYAEMAMAESDPNSPVTSDLEEVLKAAIRARELVKQILAFSRQAETERILLQPAILLKEALKMLRPSLPTTIDIIHNIDPEVGCILADPTQIQQIIMNICTNAYQAMEKSGGRIEISLREITLDKDYLVNELAVEPGVFIQLTISDSGPGIPPDIKDKIFNPYFTTKEIGKGTGMGLSIVHGIVKSYGGFVSFYSELGVGTSFHIFLPVAREDVAAGLHSESLKIIQTGTERILFVDDEEALAELGGHILERLGYRVTVKTGSQEALDAFLSQPEQFDLVITDQTMPGMPGSEMAGKMLQARPDIPIILCTGYSSIISEEEAKAIGIKEFALKPLVKSDIAGLVRKVLDGT